MRTNEDARREVSERTSRFPSVLGIFADYDPEKYYCEMFGRPERPLTHTTPIVDRLGALPLADLGRRSRSATRELYNFGITFTVYTKKSEIDRILPFDVIPRVISSAEWGTIERGVQQRVAALNLFLSDVYHDQKNLNDGVVPRDLVLANQQYRREMRDFAVPLGSYTHVCGIDIVRGEDGAFSVLEDNARTPSGVSYVIENRHLTRRAFPDLMYRIGLRSVSNYGQHLIDMLTELAPAGVTEPQVALLSPGTYNAAYFLHVFLAREMGVPLVEGRDLFVDEGHVFMKTINGPQPVHVIYRRIDDSYLDPEVFNPKSVLGVKGLMRAYRSGTVALANAVGSGVADDKAVCAYMPRIIRYYLDEDPVLPNVETHVCREADGLAFTLDHLKDLVAKPVGASGGYGITIGPHASRRQLAACAASLRANPENYISQPMVNLSVCPTLVNRKVVPRHVDLRPFALTGKSTWVLPGGLTRVALRQGSMLVNSSQGGGSKDTWVLD